MSYIISKGLLGHSQAIHRTGLLTDPARGGCGPGLTVTTPNMHGLAYLAWPIALPCPYSPLVTLTHDELPPGQPRVAALAKRMGRPVAFQDSALKNTHKALQKEHDKSKIRLIDFKAADQLISLHFMFHPPLITSYKNRCLNISQTTTHITPWPSLLPNKNTNERSAERKHSAAAQEQ